MERKVIDISPSPREALDTIDIFVQENKWRMKRFENEAAEELGFTVKKWGFSGSFCFGEIGLDTKSDLVVGKPGVIDRFCSILGIGEKSDRKSLGKVLSRYRLRPRNLSMLKSIVSVLSFQKEAVITTMLVNREPLGNESFEIACRLKSEEAVSDQERLERLVQLFCRVFENRPTPNSTNAWWEAVECFNSQAATGVLELTGGSQTVESIYKLVLIDPVGNDSIDSADETLKRIAKGFEIRYRAAEVREAAEGERGSQAWVDEYGETVGGAIAELWEAGKNLESNDSDS